MAHFQRYLSLLTESCRLSLGHCDLIKSIVIELESYVDNVLAIAKVIHTITSLGLSNLHLIVLSIESTTPSLGEVLESLDYICSSSLPITDIKMEKVPYNTNLYLQEESLLFLLNRFGDTLKRINIDKAIYRPEIQDAIDQCSHIESISLTFPIYQFRNINDWRD